MNVELDDGNGSGILQPSIVSSLLTMHKLTSSPPTIREDCEMSQNLVSLPTSGSSSSTGRPQKSNDDPKRVLRNKIRSLSAMGMINQINKCENEWQNKVEWFRVKTVEKEKEDAEKKKQKFKSIVSMTSSTEKRNIIKALVKETYRRHHPRRVILDFFNDVAREGAHNVEKTGTIQSSKSLHPMLRYFNRASVFTVWRPTSMDAMIKMIRCEAVGKGLDIKAKSALRGKLSGYVPFLQISNNQMKSNIDKRILSAKNGTVRLYFQQDEAAESTEAEKARAKVLKMLEKIADEILNMKKLEELQLALSNTIEEEGQISILQEIMDLNKKSLQLRGEENSSIKLINDYAPSSYGLEIPMIVFWEAYMVRQDVSYSANNRTVGGSSLIYETGRKSSTRHQNLNLIAALYNRNKKAPKDSKVNDKDDHRTVLVQNVGVGPSSPLNTFELLMAYEIHAKKKVLPVVSDCDCFLVGTRRVTYKTPMDPKQIEIMKWNIDEIEQIIKDEEEEKFVSSAIDNDRKNNNNHNDNSTTVEWNDRWDTVLSNNATKVEEGQGGIEIKIPKIGFGDPKSCSIMKNAVDRLIGSGSGGVRHGAECFNYYVPQDTGDSFIVISDDLPDNKPWMKVNLNELHHFLNEKIDLSYTFPIHPKWILYDEGTKWKEHYDKLMNFDNENTQDSMNVWFPKDSGIREQIERVYTARQQRRSNSWKEKKIEIPLPVNSHKIWISSAAKAG